MENVTMHNIQAAVLLLLGIAAILVSLDKGIAAWNHLRKKDEAALKEKALNDRLIGIESRLSDAETRLERGDRKFDGYSKDMTMVLSVLQAVLIHMYSGNDHEKLRGTIDDLNDYMSRRAY